VVLGHRERGNGRSGGHGFTVHIRDVYFSRYLDRSGLTLLSHFLSAILRKREVTYDIPFEWTLLPTRLRKLFASQCTRHVRLLVPVI
jgi:hypothetical protein